MAHEWVRCEKHGRLGDRIRIEWFSGVFDECPLCAAVKRERQANESIANLRALLSTIHYMTSRDIVEGK